MFDNLDSSNESKMTAFEAAKEGYFSAVPLIGIVAGIISTVMDLAEPLAPVTFYAFALSTIVTVTSFVLFLLSKWRKKVSIALIFSAFLALFSGGLWGWQSLQNIDESRGALASTFPFIASIQNQLGLIREDLADIARNTKATAQATERSAKALEDISEGLGSVAKLGGLIDDPQSISDFVNNASVYETRGDTLNARKMYEKAILSNAAFVDLQERYLAILKAQEGLLGAREVYADIASRQMDNPVTQMINISISSRSQREKLLDKLTQDYPKFGPAHYEKTKLYVFTDGTMPTAEERKKMMQAWKSFALAYERGHVLRWYLNKNIPESILKMAKAYESSEKMAMAYGARPEPVTARSRFLVSDWLLDINISDGAKRIWVKKQDEADFEEAEVNPIFFRDTPNGRLTHVHGIRIAAGTPVTQYKVKYEDARGKIQGPYMVKFDPEKHLVEEAKLGLKSSVDFWVFSSHIKDKYEIMLPLLPKYYCGISSLKYSFNSKKLDKVFKLPKNCGKDPTELPEGWSNTITTKRPLKTLSLKFTFKDGKATKLRTYNIAYAKAHDKRQK